MRRIMMGFIAASLLLLLGCSSGGGSESLKTAAYNSVYGVNALSAGENISLYTGDQVIETVLPYDQNASIIEKAVGSDLVAAYKVTGGSEVGHTVLQSGKTYFYAATDCTDIGAVTQYALAHTVETDTQINIVNTSSDPFSTTDINISVDGVQVNNVDITECTVSPVALPSAQDQNISVRFSGGSFSVWKVLPPDANVSVDIVIYPTLSQTAAIIPLPRLTLDAL
ncbi:MAG: hypothetical protein ABFR02_04420 [Campylobacterota bacterium]